MRPRTFEEYELLIRFSPAGTVWGLDVTPLRTIITFDKYHNAKLMQRVMRPIKDEISKHDTHSYSQTK